MGDMLVKWCKKNDVLLLSAITPDQAIKFRMSLPIRTGDSSSLSVHWSVISGFFNWAMGMGYIEKTPILSGRQNKQFAIPFKKKEVVPPTKEGVEKVLATALGKVKILARLMRETGMALVDAQKVGMTFDDAQKFGLSKPERLPVLEDESHVARVEDDASCGFRITVKHRRFTRVYMRPLAQLSLTAVAAEKVSATG